MLRGLRFCAALLALLALLASTVEQAWAVTCMGMGMNGSAPTGAEAGSIHSEHSGGASAPAAPDHRTSHSSSDAAPCPMAAAAGGVCGVAGVPVASATSPLAGETQRTTVPGADEAPASPQLSSLFRPPRR